MKPKTDQEIEWMTESGQMLATVLDLLITKADIGVTPRQLAKIASKELRKLGGKPAFLGVSSQGLTADYPDVICISVNDQVQHSIPNDRQLTEGDVVNFDFGVSYRGMITDAGITVGIGKINSENQRLINATEQALKQGIAVVRDGTRVGDVSAAVQKVLDQNKLGIVRELVGHGVGHELHEEPEIPNYGKAGLGPILRSGMTIAIEPIANLGSRHIYVDVDGWTIRTEDKSNSAQFEHTILVTETGSIILTKI
ncbi:MAG: type I methionyl aminopeptidase [Patescibacteria group bacterium]